MADEWASLTEPPGRGLLDAVLATGLFTPGTRVLDAGCGSDLFAERIAALGCDVIGLDALPLPDEYVGLVVGINSFQYAASPRHAIVEARRVTRRGGHVILATWGPPYTCEAAAYLSALRTLLPSWSPYASEPFARRVAVAR
jgi:ubiquinone/menaquinone biosynthesis C-methylase UbiE